MSKKIAPSNPDQVKTYLNTVNHPLKNVLMVLREVILSIDPEIQEQIKWNSVSMYYAGEMKEFDPKLYLRDIVVFNIHKNDQVLLVFPTGARIKDKTGILQGNFSDGRKTISIKSLEEFDKYKDSLQIVIKEWLNTTEK